MIDQLSIDLNAAAASSSSELVEKQVSLSHLATLLLRQIKFWSSKEGGVNTEEGHWFHKSAREFVEELRAVYQIKTSVPSVLRALKRLEKLGLVVRKKLWQRYWSQKYFYQLTEAADRYFQQFKPLERRKKAKPPKEPPQKADSLTPQPNNSRLVTVEQCIQKINQKIRTRPQATGFQQPNQGKVSPKTKKIGSVDVLQDGMWAISDGLT
ncbi:hypothetical protein [Synechococcus elongatus]|uniref:hypothetical protein n=1 Tax=Synechococcus elongatus TaxID=32046 RepID=UPI0030CF2656